MTGSTAKRRNPFVDLEAAKRNRRRVSALQLAEAHMTTTQRASEHHRLNYGLPPGYRR